MVSRYAGMSPLEEARWERQYAVQQLRKSYIKADAALSETWQKRKAEAEAKIKALEGN